MKRTLSIIALLFFTVLSTTLKAENEERHVAAFSEISLRIDAEVYLDQDKDQSIELVAETSTLGKIITEVKNGKLIIRFKNKDRFIKPINHGKIKIFVTVPDITSINVSGSGDIYAENPIESRIIKLFVSGMGGIKLEELKSDQVECTISGSGDIELLSGTCREQMGVAISGSGNLRASGYQAKSIAIKTVGSGDSFVNATDRLKVRIIGAGNVVYSGKPQLDSSVTGSGNVKRK
ncbi:DUF2807 domain-containing protein [Puteibacter caeruleilacunae]|nr:DUF2807 domain-containing protein [Puteibacter caeruleilacunae]